LLSFDSLLAFGASEDRLRAVGALADVDADEDEWDIAAPEDRLRAVGALADVDADEDEWDIAAPEDRLRAVGAPADVDVGRVGLPCVSSYPSAISPKKSSEPLLAADKSLVILS